MRYRIDALLAKKINVLALPAVLLILNLIDAITTGYGLSHGIQEMNPLFSYAVVPGKFLGCGVLFVTSYLQNQLNPKAKYVNAAILCVVIIIYLFVVVNNIFSLLTILWI
jgi:hypothetical protein